MPYTSVTRAQLRALLRNQLGSGGLSSAFWRDDELNKIIQEALRFFNLLTGFWKQRAVMSTTAGTVWYGLPGTLTSAMRVSFNGFPLSPSSFYDLDFGRSGWESERTSDGGDVPARPQLFVIGGLNKLGLWPADAAGSNGLVIDGLAVTPILTSDASQVDLGQEEMNALLDYCQHAAAFKEGGLEWKNTLPLLKGFLESAGERNAILRRCATWRKWMGLDQSRWQRPLKAGDEKVGAR